MASKNTTFDRNKIVLVNRLERGHLCNVCDLVLQSPLQTTCGHRFCEECIKGLITSGSNKCPEDTCDTVLSLQQINRDEFCNREIMELKCFCSGKNHGCTWEGPLKDLEAHQSECPKSLLDCPKGCPATVPRSEIENHFDNECPFGDANCPMVGQCDFQGSRAELRRHLAEGNVEHAIMVQNKIEAKQSDIEIIQGANTQMQQRQQVFENRVANQRAELRTLRDDFATLRTADQQEADTLENLKEWLRKLEDQVASYARRNGQGIPHEAVVDLEGRVVAMERQNASRDAKIADHNARLSMLEATSYDGIFLWKIEDYGRLLNEAMMGKRLFIDSPPFYVGRHGYKVYVRAYLNGDGLGKGTHLSLSIVVMRGEYDGLLPWPFQQRVTFKLIDQCQDQHIIDSFRPSLQQPIHPMNIASGSPLFVPRAVLTNGEYIKEDAMFLKITVDTTGIPNF